MPPLPCPSRPLRAALFASLLLAGALAAQNGLAAPVVAPIDAADARDLAGRLAQARTESDTAEAALDAAKRVTSPGHLLDPLPGRLMAGVGELQAEYAEMERTAAGYRATLGDQHPTLKGAEEVMAGLRGQILDGARRAISSAQEDATRARAAVASLERQTRAAEVTGSIAPAAPAPSPGPANTSGAERPVAAATPAAAVEPTARETPHADGSAPHAGAVRTSGPTLLPVAAGDLLPLALRYPGAAAAAGFLASIMGLGLLVALVRPRARRKPAPERARIEPAALLEILAAPTRTAARLEPALQASAPPPATVAVPATLRLRADDDAAAVRERLDRNEDVALARGAASVFATLAASAGADPRSRVSVAVMPASAAAGAQADAAALALASAAVDAGRRVLLIDGHPDGRLARALVHGAAVVASVDFGGRPRNLVRLTVAGRVLAVLAGDAEGTVTEHPSVRLPNLDGFDTIVTAGEPGTADTERAGFALVVAPHGAASTDLAAAARSAAGETGRPCSVLVIETLTADVVEAPRQSESFLPRRRIGPEAATARLGLRRTFDPARRRA